MFGPKRTQETPIVQEEWDFSQIEDPADAEACLRYELAREVPNPREYFSGFPNLETAPFAFHPLPTSESMAEGASADFWHEVNSVFTRAGDELASNESRDPKELYEGMYFRHPGGDIRAYPFDLQTKPWQKLDPDWQLRLSLYAEQKSSGFFPHNASQIEDSGLNFQAFVERLKMPGKRHLFAASVDWTKSDTDLIKGFADWLATTRPKGFPSTTLIGRQSAFDHLNALSALRLRHWLSVEEAVKYTRAVRGKSPYKERPAWERAHRRAIILYHLMYPGAGEALSACKIGNRQD